jgi:DNA polymerase-3 subunit alpha
MRHCKAKFIVGQNLGFDLNIMGSEFHRLGLESQMSKMPVLDTCTEAASLLKLPVVVEDDLNYPH